MSHRIAFGTDIGVHVLGEGQPCLDRSVTALAPDGHALLALVDGNEVWRAGSGTAELVATLDDDRAGCLVAHHGDVWLGGDEAALWRQAGTTFEPVTSFGSAPTSDAWYTPWGGPASTFSLASAGDDLYVNVHVGGIVRTDDDGRTWHATIDLHDDVHQVTARPDGRVWAATGSRGLGTSDDRGASWRYVTNGLHATYLLAAAPTSDGVIVSASSGHSGRDSAVYRLEDDHFVRCEQGLPDHLGGTVHTGHLAADGDTVVLATPDREVYVSTDGGRSWAWAHRSATPITSAVVLPG